MAIQALKKLRSLTNKEAVDVQDNVYEWALQFFNNELVTGRLIEGVSVGTTNTNVSHRLGRQLRGWFITKLTADARVWQVEDSTLPEFLILKASTAVTVNVWVF